MRSRSIRKCKVEVQMQTHQMDRWSSYNHKVVVLEFSLLSRSFAGIIYTHIYCTYMYIYVYMSEAPVSPPHCYGPRLGRSSCGGKIVEIPYDVQQFRVVDDPRQQGWPFPPVELRVEGGGSSVERRHS